MWRGRAASVAASRIFGPHNRDLRTRFARSKADNTPSRWRWLWMISENRHMMPKSRTTPALFPVDPLSHPAHVRFWSLKLDPVLSPLYTAGRCFTTVHYTSYSSTGPGDDHEKPRRHWNDEREGQKGKVEVSLIHLSPRRPNFVFRKATHFPYRIRGAPLL